jgi:Uma2 family endonuclease
MATLLNIGTTPITVERYHEMIEQGILGPDERVELLEGVIVPKMPKHPPHSVSNDICREALSVALPPGWFVRTQNPVTLSTSEPEPDLAVVRGRLRDYSNRHPQPGEIGLVMEIADASLDRDRTLKKRIYGSAGVPHYWLLNLNNRTLEVYSEPRGGDCAQRAVYEPTQSVELVLDGKVVANISVGDLLP